MSRIVENTQLSLKDMENLVTVYDAVRKLHIVMLGEATAFPKSEGILGALDYVYDVIVNGVCAEFQQMGEENL